MSSHKAVSRTGALGRALVTVLLVFGGGALVYSHFSGDRAAPVATTPAYHHLRASDPVRLIVPALHVRTPILPIQLASSGVLSPPSDPKQVGWWNDSARPGAPRGQVVITGHTVHTGGGALDLLRALKPGQKVDVRTRAGRMRYSVERVLNLTKAQVAARAVSLFGQRGGAGRLVLVTCTAWNGSEYLKNTIVFAKPLGEPVA